LAALSKEETTAMTDIGIVIVNYNATDFLNRCLASVTQETREVDFQITVVDNASTDQDITEIQERFPQIHLIQNNSNRGFSFACNQGIRNESARNYLLLNPDCIIEDGAIDRCLAYLESQPDAGVLGCRVNNPDGTLQLACRRSIPSAREAFYRFSGLSIVFPRSPRFAGYNLSYTAEDKIQEVGAVSGSFLMVKREVLDTIGLLDETFFLYGEDLDFCYRASLAGWRVLYYPEARVTHFKRASSSREVQQSNRHFYHAMQIFYRKHYHARASRFERAVVLAGIRLLFWFSRLRLFLHRNQKVGSPY
jgi:GT2 family glycosyltransferase